MKRYIIALLTITALLSSCSVYKKYESKTSAPEGLFGAEAETVLLQQEASLADLSWREFFKDPVLQAHIDSALVKNVDIRIAKGKVEQAEIALKQARLAYIPTFNVNLSGSVSSLNVAKPSYDTSLPLQVSWQPDLFFSITNAKRRAKALYNQSLDMEEITKINVISSVAQQYLMLQSLDRQLEILYQSEQNWNKLLDIQKALMENGMAYSTAVNQMESSLLNVKAKVEDCKKQIIEMESSLCTLLGIIPQHIKRSPWNMFQVPDRFGLGIPALILTRRADVRSAERNLEAAFYNTASARSAFFPRITLEGLAGWNYNAGAVDPHSFLLKAAASLLMPLFNQGKLRAQLKIAKIQQEDAAIELAQTILKAGNQVNSALARCQVAIRKNNIYDKQIEVLTNASEGTKELMINGKTRYLEVLTAEEGLLNAQISEALNNYDSALAVIQLYIALGGCAK